MMRLQLITIFLLVSLNLVVGIKLSNRKVKTIKENRIKLFKSIFGEKFDSSEKYIYYTENLNYFERSRAPTSCFNYLAFNINISAALQYEISNLRTKLKLCPTINLIFVVMNSNELTVLSSFIESLNLRKKYHLYIEYGGINEPNHLKDLCGDYKHLSNFEAKYKDAYESLCKYGLYELNTKDFKVTNLNELCLNFKNEGILPVDSVLKP